MNKKERVNYIQRRLSELYPDPAVPLEHRDAYTLLIAVILSAQCTDVRVNQITPKLFKKADNPRDILPCARREPMFRNPPVRRRGARARVQ